ncbi:MAG: hypothetical protein ACREPM_24075 [Gemmatimonadaceae bacterium]
MLGLRSSWIIFVFVGAVAGSLPAQAPGQPLAAVRQGTLIPIPYRTFVAFDPALVVFDFGSLEVESAVAPGVTIGGVGSYTVVDHDHYASGDFTLRYYPGEVVLRGLSVGLSAGLLRYSTPDSSGAHPSIVAPTIGLVTDYNWMIGPTRRFILGTGVGAKRVLASADERRRVDLGRVYLTARFVLGYAF